MLDLLPPKEELCEIFDYKGDEGILLWRVGHNGCVPGARAGRAVPGKNGYYTVRLTVKGVPRRFYVHRVVYAMHHGEVRTRLDHSNGVKTDNRIENLRPATHSQNMHNARIAKTNTSGVKGVCYDKSRRKWVANVWLHNKQIHIGRFDTIEGATVACRNAREKLHGGYARHE